MCGINGITHRSGAPVDPGMVRRMRDCQDHRGPDDVGEYFADGIGFGFRRLSIIDLSPAGHQPMSNEDGTIWLIFNGEVYNFQELRKNLEQRHTFRSHTDSETILHAYEEQGTACFAQLRGMFALAIWDGNKKKLILARDRFGKKPLVYAETRNGLAFASELQGLLPALDAKPAINTSVLAQYLRLQYIPSPSTIYQGVYKLPPAHFAEYENGTLRIQRYWQLSFARPDTTPSFEEAGQEFERRLRESVRLRMLSDVPLGVFLSGGLDSSIITAIMAQESQTPVKTFSIGFSEQSHNELPLARLVAQRYKTDHHESILSPNVAELLPMLMRHYGEPFGDSSALATYAVARETRKFVTVALNGDGGDENFAGYEKYAFLAKLQRLDSAPQSIRKAAQAAITLISPVLPHHTGRRLRIAARFATEDFFSRYADTMFASTEEDLGNLLSHDVLRQAEKTEEVLRQKLTQAVQPSTLVDRITALDLLCYLPDCLMTKADIATMAASLEGRSPFLDHTVVEYTATLPAAYKMYGGVRKYLLRKQLGHLLPTQLLNAPKRGFDLPVNAWMRSELASFVRERLTDRSFRDLPYFQHATIDRLLDDHGSGKQHNGIILWSLLCFAEWYKVSGA